MNPDFINPLVLAYLGDSVLELLVRDYLVKESELKKVNELCQEATHFVSSLSHEKFILHLLEIDFLTEKEVGIFKRGRKRNNINVKFIKLIKIKKTYYEFI